MIYIDTSDAFPVVSFYGEFDLANVEEIDQTLSAYDSTPVLIVSLEEAMFIDSSVLGALSAATTGEADNSFYSGAGVRRVSTLCHKGSIEHFPCSVTGPKRCSAL